MKQKKDQFIALCADRLAEAERLLPTARRLSEDFRKGIILFTCSADGDEWVEKVDCPHVVLKGDWATAVEAMPVAFNVVMALALTDPAAPRKSLAHPRQFLKHFRQSKIAYLAVPTSSERIDFRHVGLTLDHQRESKEKLIWASYMARFCGSSIDVYHLPYSDPNFRSRCENNIRYLKKVFSSLSLDYGLHVLEGGSQFAQPDPKALALGENDMFIVQVADSRDRDLLDTLLPPLSLRILRGASSTPILFLNQRDDLYVMCD